MAITSASLRAEAGRGIEMLPRAASWRWSVASPVDGSLMGRALAKRHMRGGAVAGTVVGTVVGVVLLILCLYPFVVHLLKRRRAATDSAPFDPEAAIAAAKSGRVDEPVARGPRVSSTSSFQQHNPETIRIGEPGWAVPRGAYGQEPPAAFDSNAGWVFDEGDNYSVQAAPFPQLGCFYGALAPPVAGDAQPGVLKGESAEYYSTSIPSEAFGMVPEPGPTLDADPPTRESSHGGSFSQGLRSLFRRQSSRDETVISVSHIIIEEATEPSTASPRQPIITDEDQVESPTSISPTSIRGPPLIATLIDPSLFNARHQAPSPPLHPAPGTVNPMDIMPASTESEHWHRTEHQLYMAASYEMAPSKPLPDSAPTDDKTQPWRTTRNGDGPHPFLTVQSPGATTDALERKLEFSDNGFGQALLMGRIPATKGQVGAPDGRNASVPSEQSTPFLGHGFTDVSSQNTPSTQLDTPSPESGGSSDYRLSTSPQPVHGVAMARGGGVYHCDEPGCSQVFDQPHKLKHHQRYHSKDHKCLYPGCGKGFGTKTHLQRHINDRHDKKKKYHCSVAGCDYSRTGGKAFPRKDNWKRHMMKIHNMGQQELPEPIEADVDMSV